MSEIHRFRKSERPSGQCLKVDSKRGGEECAPMRSVADLPVSMRKSTPPSSGQKVTRPESKTKRHRWSHKKGGGGPLTGKASAIRGKGSDSGWSGVLMQLERIS